MEPRKIYAIAIALTKSQLRTSTSGRAGASFFRRPSIIFVLDVVALVISLLAGYAGVIALKSIFPGGSGTPGGISYALVVTLLEEALIFIPTFVPSAVLLGGLLFELNVSSKFSASDTINWLPVTQTEYVTASALSVAYNYSVAPVIFLGATLAPAFYLGFGWLWIGVSLFSLLGLVTGGILVEILRAAVNRVSSIVSGKTRRGAFVLRLLLLVVIILVIDTSFNPDVLIGLVNSLSTTISLLPFVPILWGSVAMDGVARGDVVTALGFSVGAMAFTAFLGWVAVLVRSRYWAPMVGAVSFGQAEYRPQLGTLVRLGLSSTEAAIVRKDIKGVTRRRELISYFAVPIVFVAIFIVDTLSPSMSSDPQGLQLVTDIPVFLAASIFALMVSSISFGQESKSVMVLYSMPVSPEQILKAKAFSALVFALTATLGTLAVFFVLGREPTVFLLENMLVAVAITVEEVFIGLGFGAAYPDFQERPRPRFVDPFWLIVMIPIGLVIAFVTAVPIVFRDILGALPLSGTSLLYLFPASIVFAIVVTVFGYRWARGSVRRLMAEYKI